jgi:hypothetical protein
MYDGAAVRSGGPPSIAIAVLPAIRTFRRGLKHPPVLARRRNCRVGDYSLTTSASRFWENVHDKTSLQLCIPPQ